MNTFVQMDYYCNVCDKYVKPRSKYKFLNQNPIKNSKNVNI